MPLTPSREVSLSNQNKHSGVSALSTGELIKSSLMSLKAFSASSVHLNFLDFYCRSYIGIKSCLRLGRNDDKKLTIPQNALVCVMIWKEFTRVLNIFYIVQTQ